MLTAKIIKEKAIELGASACGIGDIKYFEGTNPQRDPKSILPNAKCVIGFAFRVPRALYDTMERGVQFFQLYAARHKIHRRGAVGDFSP